MHASTWAPPPTFGRWVCCCMCCALASFLLMASPSCRCAAGSAGTSGAVHGQHERLCLAGLQTLTGRYSMPDGRHPALRSLITDMLVVSPHQRPDISQVRQRATLQPAPPRAVALARVSGGSTDMHML